MEEYNQFEPAIEQLKTVAANGDKKDLLFGLATTRIGVLQARSGKCEEAIATWEQILQNKSQEHLYATVQLKKGLCFETLGRMDEAKKTYEEVSAKWPEEQEGQQAKKFLRLLVSSL
jgi:TolA-binding protein